MVYHSNSSDRVLRVDHLQRYLNALKVDERPDGEHRLGAYVEAEQRQLPTDAFAHLDKEIQTRVTTLAKRYGDGTLSVPVPGTLGCRTQCNAQKCELSSLSR
jgi:hypothetical protein